MHISNPQVWMQQNVLADDWVNFKIVSRLCEKYGRRIQFDIEQEFRVFLKSK